MNGQGISLGVDLGGSNIRAALVDGTGALTASSKTVVGPDRDPAAIVARTAQLVSRLVGDNGLTLAGLRGVGVGLAAQIRGESGMVALAPNLGWKEVPFGEMISAELGRTVRVVNDVEAVTWGETLFGAARNHKDVLLVFLGTGVGGGMVLDGRLYRGICGVSAEIGHVKVRAGGDLCGCGSRGCLEAYLGGANLSRRLVKEAETSWTELRALSEDSGGVLHPGMVETLAERGDPKAKELFRELAEYLGTVLANAVTLVNPSALVLGGTVLVGCPTLQMWTEEVFRARVLPVSGEAVKILNSQLEDSAGMIGAAHLS